MSDETDRRIKILEIDIEAKEREISELKHMLGLSRNKEESNYLETCESHTLDSNAERLQNFYKSVIDEKDHNIQRLEDQLSFIKSAYRELQTEDSLVSLEFLRDAITCILKRLPILSKETETMIDILTNMLGVSVSRKQEIKEKRENFDYENL